MKYTAILKKNVAIGIKNKLFVFLSFGVWRKRKKKCKREGRVKRFGRKFIPPFQQQTRLANIYIEFIPRDIANLFI